VYCKLSEGREVFERMAEAFWPGALTIMAKATWKCVGENHRLLFHSSMDSCARTDTDGIVQVTDESKAAAMALYVGIRCPSHPLTQCILREAKVPVFAATAISRHSQCGTSNSKPLLQASRVCDEYVARIETEMESTLIREEAGKFKSSSSLLQSTEGEDDLSDNTHPSNNTIIQDVDEYNCSESSSSSSLFPLYVVNGEDKREIFTVSTCELAGESTIIKIDETRKRVILMRKGVGPSKEQIARKLYRVPNPCQGDKLSTSQIITTALLRKKWKVVDSNELLDPIQEVMEGGGATASNCSKKNTFLQTTFVMKRNVKSFITQYE